MVMTGICLVNLDFVWIGLDTFLRSVDRNMNQRRRWRGTKIRGRRRAGRWRRLFRWGRKRLRWGRNRCCRSWLRRRRR